MSSIASILERIHRLIADVKSANLPGIASLTAAEAQDSRKELLEKARKIIAELYAVREKENFSGVIRPALSRMIQSEFRNMGNLPKLFEILDSQSREFETFALGEYTIRIAGSDPAPAEREISAKHDGSCFTIKPSRSTFTQKKTGSDDGTNSARNLTQGAVCLGSCRPQVPQNSA